MNEKPGQLTSMAMENPPPVAPTLTAQEQSVLYGAVRDKIRDNATIAGAGMGAIGGALIGGILGIVGRGGATNHWGRKLLGGTVVAAAIGALAGRLTWGKDMGEKTVTNMQEQMNTLPPEQQAAAYQYIAQQVGLLPQTSVQASTIQHQTMQAAPTAPQLG